MAARRTLIEYTNEYFAAAKLVEVRLAEIVGKVCGERDVLRTENEVLKKKLAQIELAQRESRSNESSNAVLDFIERCNKSDEDQNPVEKKAMGDFVALLKSMYPVRLDDDEMLRLAALSKLQTEIKQRHIDVERGN